MHLPGGLPLNHNGKVDKSALPSPENINGIAPAYFSLKEQQVHEIFTTVLGSHSDGDADFFESGGNSLLFLRVLSHVQRKFGIRLSYADAFRYCTVKGIAKLVRKSLDENLPALKKAALQTHYPLSPAQYRLWAADMVSGNNAYNIPVLLHIEGPLDIGLLEKGLNYLVGKHEILRTALVINNGQPQQEVIPANDVNFKISFTDQRHRSFNQNDFVTDFFACRFDLRIAPQFSIAVVQTGETQFVLGMVMHHALSDAWSIKIFLSELTHVYRLFKNNNLSAHTDAGIQYKDYAVWMTQLSGSGMMKRAEDYWENKISQIHPVQLPLDFPDAVKEITYPGKKIAVNPGALTIELLRLIARQNGATTAVMFQALVKILLYKLGNTQGVAVAVPLAGRIDAQLDNCLGVFLNTILLSDELHAKDSFITVLGKIKESLVEAQEHQAYSFEQVLRFVPEADHLKFPDVLVDTYEFDSELENKKVFCEDIFYSEIPVDSTTAKFPLSFFYYDGPQPQIVIEYSTNHFKDNKVFFLQELLISIAKQVASEPGITLENISTSKMFDFIPGDSIPKEAF
jgi:acyl carrier protein